MIIKFPELPEVVQQSWRTRFGDSKDGEILRELVFGESFTQSQYEPIKESAEAAALRLYQWQDHIYRPKGARKRGGAGTYKPLHVYSLDNLMERMWDFRDKADKRDLEVYFAVATAILIPIVGQRLACDPSTKKDEILVHMQRERSGILRHFRGWIEDKEKFEHLKRQYTTSAGVFSTYINNSLRSALRQKEEPFQIE